ncbi:LAETG motif-containing sortase-dependent surface protein [Streptomyces melanogenes]|uniref:LAETG motif-containing sortase-dependent surface protein n=1 Tax=Streptomyces melanogenes TaxID=67326 RepID=UPI0037AC66A4
MFSVVHGLSVPKSVRKRGAARLAAAVAVSGLVAGGAIAGAGTAVADQPGQQHQGGAVATIKGLDPDASGKAVIHQQGGDRPVSAGLFQMVVDGGGTLRTYCIDIHNPTQPAAKYQETPWSGTSLSGNPDAGKIRWILEHSYPQVNDLTALAKSAGLKGQLTNGTAAAATQVAIWRYSDHAQVDAVDAQAKDLADWLTKSAQNVGEPRASLTLDNPAVSGKAGSKLGPVTVHTNADKVSVTPSEELKAAGVKVVDKAGKAATTAKNGSQLFFDVPAGAQPGSGSLTVQATTQVPVGRAFASESKSQTQILAGSSDSTVTAAAKATWAKQGAIPALTAAKNCAKGGVDVTATNKGDEAFTFKLAGFSYTIGAGKSKTVTVPVAEDQAYDFVITGPNGFKQEFKGVLDCKTAGTPSTTKPSSQPSPASAGGTSSGSTTGGDLAETGSSSSTPMIAGVAVALVVIGGGAVFFLRRKKAGTAGH